jgi:hypothetical protein
MKVSFKDDRMPDGTELHVRSLGMLVNGSSVEFSEERVAAFEADKGMSLEDAFKDDERVMVGKASKLPLVDEEPVANLDPEVIEDKIEEAKGGDDS